MSGSAVAMVGQVMQVSHNVVRASGDITLTAGDEVKLTPTTRAVVVTTKLPSSDAGIDAEWFTTMASRKGTTYEYAEVKCFINLAGTVTAAAGAAADLIIGVDGIAASLGQFTAANFGTVLSLKMECLELPLGGTADIDLYANSAGTLLAGGAAVGTMIIEGAIWEIGEVKYHDGVFTEGGHMYLASGDNNPGTYTKGKFLLTFYCRYTL